MRFLQAYEDNFGNVTIACKVAGIHRQTFYRWLDSPSRINIKFRKRLAQTRPDEKYVDFLETAFTSRVAAGSDSLIQFGLKTRGRRRGWSEKPELFEAPKELLHKVADAYQAWLADHDDLPLERKVEWLGKFARARQIEPVQLAKIVGMEISTWDTKNKR